MRESRISWMVFASIAHCHNLAQSCTWDSTRGRRQPHAIWWTSFQRLLCDENQEHHHTTALLIITFQSVINCIKFFLIFFFLIFSIFYQVTAGCLDERQTEKAITCWTWLLLLEFIAFFEFFVLRLNFLFYYWMFRFISEFFVLL